MKLKKRLPKRRPSDEVQAMPEDALLETPRGQAEPPGESSGSTALRNAVRFKGWRGGLLISVPAEIDWDGAIAGLCERMGQAREFWEGAPCTLDLAVRDLSADALKALVNRLSSEFDLSIVGVVTQSEAARQAAAALAIDADSELPSAGARPAEPDLPVARYLSGPIRSGVVVEAPGHLVVMGDVNAGAEVRAGGDIVVFGTLRGVAHAGTQGDLTVRIQAINLRPTQLRIGELIARAPDGGQPPLSKFPEKAVVDNGEIHVLPA